MARIDTDIRRTPMAGYRIPARLQREAGPVELRATSWSKLLTPHPDEQG